MNDIGIKDNLNRERIRKLLTIGLFASIITGVGDFLIGYGVETPGYSLASQMMSNAMSVTDTQFILGGLLGFIGLFLEGLSFFGIYRLMADKAPKYAHIYRSGIFGYIWLAPVGCHMNVGLFNIAYKYLLQNDPVLADQIGNKLLLFLGLPIWVLLVLFWVPMLIVQYKAFAEKKTPYPVYAKYFNLTIGMIPALVIGELIGPNNPLGPAIGTTFLCVGNAYTFLGLLLTMPDEETFEAFRKSLKGGEEND